jgi:hypothetical protein
MPCAVFSFSLRSYSLLSRSLALSRARSLSDFPSVFLAVFMLRVCTRARARTHTHTQLHAHTHRRSARMAPRLETLVVLERISEHQGRHQGRRQAQACLILIYFSNHTSFPTRKISTPFLKFFACSLAALTPSHSESRPPAPVHSCLVRRASQIFTATFLSIFLPQINPVKGNFETIVSRQKYMRMQR